jgi:uncharacterized SAM-binding protein YcdF (DUF218 family)
VPQSTRDAITQFLFLEDEAEPVDLCVVLGCPTLTNMDPAIELHQAGFAPVLLITGHGPAADIIPEWRAYRDYALRRGVPESALLIEPNATNTLENFRLSYPIVERALGWAQVRKVAIATKPFHTRRALMTARKHWPEHLQFIFRPSREPDDLPADSWWQTETGRGYVLSELRAIGAYALNGDIGF